MKTSTRAGVWAVVSFACCAGLARDALAQGGGQTGVGIGAEAMLTGLRGAAVTYEAGAFHIAGLVGLASNGQTELRFAGRFFFVVHSASSADFSLGGGVGVVDRDDGNNNEGTDFHLEGVAQLRVFLAPNVAVSASAGLGAIGGDGDGLRIDGQLVGGFGVTYFFF
jgi:hypothetical protein